MNRGWAVDRERVLALLWLAGSALTVATLALFAVNLRLFTRGYRLRA